MNYLSVCSGIEAATQAWHPLGWKPVAFSEIEPFPCKTLAHHYPNVPNLGDMTKFKEWPDYANVDVLVGGTPCQSFSIAGLRKGLDDPRGNLMLTYLAIAAKYRPKWLVWENVPGVLSSNGGKDFGTFLAGLGELGYGFSYRVLDAQYVRTDGYPYAVPQRRRRVFVVGYLGSWRRAAAVLFDTESLRGNTPPSRKAGETVAPTVSAGAPFSRTWNDRVEAEAMVLGNTCSGKEVFGTLMANCGQKQWLGNQEALSGDYHVFAIAGNTIGRKPENGGNGNGFDNSGAGYTLTKIDVHGVVYPINTQIATRHKAMGEGTGLGIGNDGDAAYTLQAAHSHAVAYRTNAAGQVMAQDGISATLNTQTDPCAQIIQSSMRVRRLMPIECERLQGFPDNFTNIPGASDSTRYKSIGNSMAVNVMQVIGERIAMCEAIK